MAHVQIEDRILPLVMLIAYLSLASEITFGQDFQNYPNPLPNRVHHLVTLPDPPVGSLSPVPPKAHAIAVRVIRDGHVVRGSEEIAGKIVGISGNLINFSPATGSPISIGFALPGTVALKSRRAVSATLSVNDNSSPFAVDQKVQITEGSHLYACYIWQSRRDPITVSLPDSAGQIQQQTNGRPVLLTTNGTTIPLKIGGWDKIASGGRSYMIFVQTAIRQRPSRTREGDGTSKSYVLKALVAASK